MEALKYIKYARKLVKTLWTRFYRTTNHDICIVLPYNKCLNMPTVEILILNGY